MLFRSESAFGPGCLYTLQLADGSALFDVLPDTNDTWWLDDTTEDPAPSPAPLPGGYGNAPAPAPLAGGFDEASAAGLASVMAASGGRQRRPSGKRRRSGTAHGRLGPGPEGPDHRRRLVASTPMDRRRRLVAAAGLHRRRHRVAVPARRRLFN